MIALVAAVLALAAPDAGASADAAAVTAAFKSYQSALLHKDGRAGAQVLARPTVEYFQRMRDLALAGKAPEVKKLTIGDKLTILRLRLEFSAAQLKPLDGRGVLEYSVSHGWVGEEVGRIGVGAVEISGDRATIAALADGKPTSERFILLREGGAWRLDLVPLFAGANAYFKKARAESGMAEDAFVMTIVEQMAGRPVPGTIWNPPK